MTETEQLYCISARRWSDNKTVSIHGPMTKERADKFTASAYDKKRFKYFRVSKYPFREHFKGDRG